VVEFFYESEIGVKTTSNSGAPQRDCGKCAGRLSIQRIEIGDRHIVKTRKARVDRFANPAERL